MNEYEVIKFGALNIQVCSNKSIEEALEWVRKAYPAGTEHNWQISDKSYLAPVNCESMPGFKHYVFDC